MRTVRLLVLVPFLLAPTLAVAQEPKKESVILTVVNKDGKEMSFKKWKAVKGTRILIPPTEPVKPPQKGTKRGPVKLPAGEEFLEFREENSTNYEEGILTLVPLSSLRKVVYDIDKKMAAATLVTADDKEAVLTGTTKYLNFNKLTIEVDIDIGELGSTAIKLQGGEGEAKARPVIRSFRFSSTGSVGKVTGPAVIINGVDKGKTVHKVHDLKALYRVAGMYRITNHLRFAKDARLDTVAVSTIDVASIARLRRAPGDKKKASINDYELTMADGRKTTLTFLKGVFPDDGSTAQFQGLIGRTPTGYKLFPLHTLSEMRLP